MKNEKQIDTRLLKSYDEIFLKLPNNKKLQFEIENLRNRLNPTLKQKKIDDFYGNSKNNR